MSAVPARALRIGFVHTAPALTPTFEDLLAEYTTPEPAEALHVADAWLLRTAMATGVDEGVHERVSRHVQHLADLGADAVLITCSSIGETIASAAEQVAIPVLRVDAAMAEQARDLAASGTHQRIAALATFESTLGPTQRLLETAAGAGIEVTAEVVAGAADAKASGDVAGHDAAIRAAAERVAATADVIVIAQASMAPAVADADLPVPALTSPRGGVQAVLAAARRAGAS
ncbi:aspartate/glutamate racemase family protein [Ruania alba]|uniref:Asp/Glu/Hydantoin racemase n=1 Tax=Ruania alba TaxID=648782 RepID=A0A1H5GBQ6_9MICO|nr:aspartate/glutamate racemase family protein [Ruania alba]SEE12924.1 hypothetical protein SAMN04488554_1597 [Ruania alba]